MCVFSADSLRSELLSQRGQSVNSLSAYSVPDNAQGIGETRGTRKPHVLTFVELTLQWRIFPVFILIDAAILLSKLLTSSAYFQGSSFKEGGCTPLPLLSARPLGSGPGPFGDMGMEWGETGMEGSREWVEGG